MMMIIQLTQGKVAFVDDDKFDYLNQWNWSVKQSDRTYYAQRKVFIDGRPKILLMQHVVFGSKVMLDHVDGNGWNNQLENLREATYLDNARNARKRKFATSSYKGVYWCKEKNKWVATIRDANLNKTVFLGYFHKDREIEAALAYDRAASRLFGVFAKLNFPAITNTP